MKADGTWKEEDGKFVFTGTTVNKSGRHNTVVEFYVRENGKVYHDCLVGVCSPVWYGHHHKVIPFTKSFIEQYFKPGQLETLPDGWWELCQPKSRLLWGKQDFDHALRGNLGVWYISQDLNKLKYEWKQGEETACVIISDGEVTDPATGEVMFMSNSKIDEKTVHLRFPNRLSGEWTMQIR